MRTFSGFPAGKVPTVNIPQPVFTELLPIIDNLDELKLTLHAIWRLEQQRGKVRYLRHADLAADQTLLASLGDSPHEKLDAALTRAIERGTLLQTHTLEGQHPDKIYFANTPKGRAAVKAIAHNEWPDGLEPANKPNIFALYEQNIGMLTPIIAEELREAEQTYPEEWVEEAFREAVTLNKRSWKYIRAILERWRTEGKEDETSRKPDQDRRRYIEGEYADYIEH
jgi:DnaD/phage-associated family protein